MFYVDVFCCVRGPPTWGVIAFLNGTIFDTAAPFAVPGLIL